jgi:hypothetical protein
VLSHDPRGIREVGTVTPDSRQPVDDCDSVQRGTAAVRSIDRFSHQGGDGRPAPAALGRQHPSALFVEVELRPTHIAMYGIHRG